VCGEQLLTRARRYINSKSGQQDTKQEAAGGEKARIADFLRRAGGRPATVVQFLTPRHAA
jgi:hypothetical protein